MIPDLQISSLICGQLFPPKFALPFPIKRLLKSSTEFGASIAQENENISNNISHDDVSVFPILSDLPIEEGRLPSAEAATHFSNDGAEYKSSKEDMDFSDGLVLPSAAGGRSQSSIPSEKFDDWTSKLSSNLLSGENITILSHHVSSGMQTNGPDAKIDETILCRFIPEENCQANEILKDVEESEPSTRDSSATLCPVSMDVRSKGNEDQDQSCLSSVFDDH